MAAPQTTSFGKGRLLIGDGGAPQKFIAPCGFTEAHLTLDKKMSDTAVPDCDNPDAVTWDQSDVVSMSWTMSFQGVLARESLPLYDGAVFSSHSRDIRFEIQGLGTAAGKPDRRYEGRAHIKMQITAKRGERMQVQIDLTGDGPLSFSDVAIGSDGTTAPPAQQPVKPNGGA